MTVDWYERQHELEPGQVFRTTYADVVRLERGVPGDGTQWYVADWDIFNGTWAHYDRTIEPSELYERLEWLE